MEEALSQAHLRLSRVTIECLPWRECLRRYDRPGTLFYLDPPYWQTEGYAVPFAEQEYVDLADAMRSLRGHAMLSINDHPRMREVFRGFRRERASIQYTIGGGDQAKSAGELIYRTW